MPELLFLPQGAALPAEGERTLLDLARAAGIPLRASCGGRGRCGACKVLPEGKDASPVTPLEEECLQGLLGKGYRLACMTVMPRGGVVHVPPESLEQKTAILRGGFNRALPKTPSPRLTFYPLDPGHLPPPTPGKGDAERLLQALTEVHGLKGCVTGLPSLVALLRVVRGPGGPFQVLVRNRREVLDLVPGDAGGPYGMAYDLGTTTVVGYLLDLRGGRILETASAMNPQTAYGDDVISRIAFSQGREDGLETLRAMVVACLQGLAEEACAQAGVAPREILEATVVGNTVMLHLLLGLDPRFLAMAPYSPVVQDLPPVPANALGLRFHASAAMVFLPLRAGFVGSDLLAGVLATRMHRARPHTLLIDLGTNGEMALGNRDRLLCCSTAAGPAFEGRHIRWGMRGSEGAIDRVRIEGREGGLRLRTVGERPPMGICGSGLISALAEALRHGLLSERGKFRVDSPIGRFQEGREGMEWVLSPASENPTGKDIVLTERDVAALQMAKAAIHAGVAVLSEGFGNKPLERVLLAGAFGNYMDPEDARCIGLLPCSESVPVQGVGNAAGHGACLALLEERLLPEGRRLARKMAYVELAGNPLFNACFTEGLFFPTPVPDP